MTTTLTPRSRLGEYLSFSNKWVRIAIIVVVVVALLAVGKFAYDKITKNTITGYFASTTGLYVGDDVRVLGVPIGTITAIDPGADAAKVTMSVDSSVNLPADAKAVVIAPTLVSARFIQLAPVYNSGPKLNDGSAIPLARTAVPVEWDEILTQLKKLSTALQPTDTEPGGSIGRALDTAANNLQGNGATMHEALTQLSQTMGLLSDGRNDLFSTVKNLQVFVQALSNSNVQIVQFGNRLASVSDVLATSSNELGSALDQLDGALGEVTKFVADNRATLTHSVQQLTDATQILVDKRPQLEQVLHVAPTALQNFYQIYHPAQGSLGGVVAMNNMTNPVAFICGIMEAEPGADDRKSGELCKQYLAPVLNTLMVNYPAVVTNPANAQTAFPQQLRYSPPSLAATAVPRTLDSLMTGGTGK